MRITGISIDGFGVFCDAQLGDLSPGLNIVLGNNEAGKSTAMGFVHAMLFGFVDGRSRDPSYPPLRGGEYGGRLFIDTDTIGNITLARGPGPRGGRLTIQGEDGEALAAADLQRALGGVDGKLYRTLYGFSLSELQSFESIAGDEIRDVIYGASMGTAGRSLPEARKHLNKCSEELFKSGGSKPEINKLLRNLEEAREQLRQAQGGILRFGELQEDIAALEQEIMGHKDSLKQLRMRSEQNRTLLNCWELWQQLREVRRSIEELRPRVEIFPVDGLPKLADLEGKLASERAELASARTTVESKRAQLEGLDCDTSLAGNGAEVVELLQGVEACAQAERDLPQALRVSRERRDEATRVLAELGGDWTEERVHSLDRSTHARETLEEHDQQLKQAESSLRQRDHDLEAAETALDEARGARETLELQLAADPPAGLDVAPSLVQQLRDGRQNFASTVRDLPRRSHERKEVLVVIQETLREISSSWTVEILAGIDTSLTAQRRIEAADEQERRCDAALLAAREQQTRAQGELQKVDQRIREVRSTLDDAVGDDRPVDARSLAQQRTRARALRDEARQLEVDLGELSRVRAETRGSATARQGGAAAGLGQKFVIVAAVVGLLGLAGAGLLYANDAAASAIGVGLGSALVAGLLLWLRSVHARQASEGRGAAGHDRASSAALKKAVEEKREHLGSALTELGLDPASVRGSATRLVATIEVRADELADLGRRAERVSELGAEREEAQQALDAAAVVVTDAQAALDQQQASWRELAASLSLPPDTSPRTATLVFGKVEKARSEQRRIQDVDRRILRMEEDRAAYYALVEQVPRLATQLEHGDDALNTELVKWLTELDESEERLRAMARIRDRLEDAKKTEAAAAEARSGAFNAQEQARADLSRTESAWQEWLIRAGINAAWSPAVTRHAFDRVQRFLELVDDRDRQSARAAELKEQLTQYRERAARLFETLGRDAPAERELLLEVRRVGEQRDRNEDRRSRHAQLQETVAEGELGIRQRQQRVENLEGELEALLTTADCGDAEDFRRRGAAYRRRVELEDEMRKCAAAIRSMASVDTLEAIEPRFEETSQHELAALQIELDGMVQAGETQLQGKTKRLGEAEQEQRSLYSEDRVSHLLTVEVSLREQLDQRARAWARYRIAEHLLDVAKERHAQANQPRVIREAQAYFSKMTGGRYGRLLAPPGEGRILVYDEHGREKDATDLSRGSAEQLYLSIRFGYIAAEAAGAEPLPVLMDDVLVNFDPDRASAAADAIVALSQRRQVLFFTCHPSMVEIFRKRGPDARLYRIQDGDLRAVSD